MKLLLLIIVVLTMVLDSIYHVQKKRNLHKTLK